VVVYSIQYEHGFVIKSTRSLDEAKRSATTNMMDGTQYWRQRCVVYQRIYRKQRRSRFPKRIKLKLLLYSGRREGTCIFGRKEIYYVHEVWWCLEIFRRLDIGRRPLLLLYLQPTYLPVDLCDIIICLYIPIRGGRRRRHQRI